MEPKDKIEEGMPPLDLEDDLYDDDPYEDYDFLDEDSFLEEEVDNPYEGLDDICVDDDYDSFDELEKARSLLRISFVQLRPDIDG